MALEQGRARKVHPRGGRCCVRWLSVLVLAATLLLAPQRSWADPASPGQARKAIQGWLRLNGRPLETRVGGDIARVDAYTDTQGSLAYYIVYLDPSGFVIVPADDDVEPIVGFAATGQYDPSPDNPLGALVSGDLAARVQDARKDRQRGRAGKPDKRGKWRLLQLIGDDIPMSGIIGTAGPGGISDVRVAPLVTSRWNQGNEGTARCYNYFTPYGYPTGCVATAMAQLMRFHQHPVAGIGVRTFSIRVDGMFQAVQTRGGNSAGGSYNWGLMVLDPDYGTTDAQRQAIGALCYDAGLAVNTNYSASVSSAYNVGEAALVDVFGYANAIRGYDYYGIANDNLIAMVNPNLDAGLPVLLGISGPTLAHAVVADGYGYSNAALYHHLNMGWGSAQDAWYNLPDIDSSPSFSTVFECGYNIYVTGTGEIISGRVLDQAGNPVVGATVTAQRSAGGSYTAVSNGRGIYALAKLPSASTYTVRAACTGYTFAAAQSVTVGTSANGAATTANRWAVNFTGVSENPPQAFDTTVTTQVDQALTIALQASDDGRPGALQYTITSLPSRGQLSDPNAGPIMAVPYTLAAGGNLVRYVPVAASGTDTFTFKAYDGGVAPRGGDSNVATVSVTILRLPSSPANPSPVDGQSKVAAGAVLSWNGGVAQSGIVYDVYCDTVSPPVRQVMANTSVAVSNPGTLQNGARYFWRVIAKNTYGSTAGPIWSFQVIANVPGDVNADGVVDMIDVMLLSDSWGTTVGDPAYSPACDLNNDHWVDVQDLLILSNYWTV